MSKTAPRYFLSSPYFPFDSRTNRVDHFLLTFSSMPSHSIISRNESIHRGLPEEIKKFIEKKYTHARFLDVKRKNGLLKVEFMHENNKKKAFFNGAKSWTLTGWKVSRRDVPQIVINAVKGKYPQGEIEDSYYVQAPKGEYYAIAIETKLDEELVVCVSAKGEILEIKSEDDFLL